MENEIRKSQKEIDELPLENREIIEAAFGKGDVDETVQ
jgi:hypothetical protein